ncbi:MAG TPA: hypothetical protein VME86_02705 [Acidobacteriaceae bacterium]|nr:hypothetical protein [Acidobacteriaceae bacterium]
MLKSLLSLARLRVPKMQTAEVQYGKTRDALPCSILTMVAAA